MFTPQRAFCFEDREEKKLIHPSALVLSFWNARRNHRLCKGSPLSSAESKVQAFDIYMHLYAVRMHK